MIRRDARGGGSLRAALARRRRPAEKPKVKKKRKVRLPKHLVKGDWSTLLDGCRGERDRVLGTVMLYAALRVSEACALEWGDVQFKEGKHGRIHVRHGKGDKERYVFLHPDCRRALHAFRYPDGEPDETTVAGREAKARENPFEPVFKSRKGGGFLSRFQAWRIVKSAARRAGLKLKPVEDSEELVSSVSPHWCRHSCATQMVAAGKDITKVQRHLGHARLETTMIYTHISDADQEAAVEDF